MSEEQIKEEQTQSVEEKKTAEEKLYSDDNVDTSIYRCANCGGEAIFDAKSQKKVADADAKEEVKPLVENKPVAQNPSQRDFLRRGLGDEHPSDEFT